jgi:hypothetical protein
MRKPAQQGLVDIDLTKPLDSMFFDHFFPSLEVSVPSLPSTFGVFPRLPAPEKSSLPTSG